MISRLLTKKNIAARTLLLMGTFVLVIHVTKNLIDHRTVNSRETVTNDRRPTKSHPETQLHPFSWPRCPQNRSAADIKHFRFLPVSLQNFLYYKHCRHFPRILDLPDKCGGAEKSAEVFLLLVIKSSPENYDRRELLRKTWAEERSHNGVRIRRVFITGTMGDGFEKERLNKVLELEQRESGDILQWDFNESFHNLTLKQILFLKWIEGNCPNVRFLLNCDDDVFANTDNVVEFLQGLRDNDGSKHLFTGDLIRDASPIREKLSKYYIPVEVHRENSYPPYCGGGGFLLSGYTALVIYKMSHSISIHPIDDVYLAMCLAKAGLQPYAHMAIHTRGLSIPSNQIDPYDPCFYREVLLVHRFLSANLFLLWRRINDPNLKCSGAARRDSV